MGGLDKTLCMYNEKYSHYIFGNRDSDRCVHVRLSLLQGMGSRTAEFAEAEQNRKIKIEEAKANLEAERLNAQAEIERAKGAAEAIKIENGSITPTYIQYLWVRQQSNLNNKTVVYIPTEANLPLLEASRNDKTVNP